MPLKRIQNTSPSDYVVLLGFYGLDFKIAADPSSISLFFITKTNIQATQFTVEAIVTNQSEFNSMKVCYFAVSKQLGNFYVEFVNISMSTMGVTKRFTQLFSGVLDGGNISVMIRSVL